MIQRLLLITLLSLCSVFSATEVYSSSKDRVSYSTRHLSIPYDGAHWFMLYNENVPSDWLSSCRSDWVTCLPYREARDDCERPQVTERRVYLCAKIDEYHSSVYPLFNNQRARGVMCCR